MDYFYQTLALSNNQDGRQNGRHLSVHTCGHSNLVIYHQISSKTHIWTSFIKLLFMSEYGYCPMNDYQYFFHRDIPFSLQGIRRGPLSKSDCSSFPLIVCNDFSCPLYNLITIRGISTKLHTFVKHIQTTCHAQEPSLFCGYFWSYFPLIICNVISCPLYNLITDRGIKTKLHTFVKHLQTTCHAQEP